jgi:signal transduction histidine kinase
MFNFTPLLQSMSSTVAQLLTSYISQSVWSVVLWLIFWYFHKIYKKSYLVYWSRSWAYYALYAFFGGLGFYFSSNYASYHPIRTAMTTLSMAGAYQQAFWLLVGTYVLAYKVKLSRKVTFWLPLMILVFSIVVSLAYNFDEAARMQRIVLRIGLKSIIFSLVFVGSGFLLMSRKQKELYLGRRIVFMAFIIFGFSQLVYFLVVIDFFKDNNFWFQISQSVLVIDSLTLSMIGLGTIIWLLEDERKELEKTNKNLDSFLYSTSHDLRAPVASLMGLINVAKHDVTDQMGQQYLNMMAERVTKLDDIFKDILAYSRTSKSEIEKSEFDFESLVRDVINDVKFNEGASSIRLIYEPSPNQRIFSDYQQLKIILSNLVSNAVKYHDPGKADQYLGIRFEYWEQDVLITVEDNGIGIPKESLDKVFNMFYRAHNYSSGSGLGLFIVKEALDRLSGIISIESEEDKGSTFTVRLKNAKPLIYTSNA